MSKTKLKRTRIPAKKSGSSSELPVLETDTDISGTDKNADHTVKQTGEHKFNKPRREENPDKTGIDIQTDFTK